MDKENKYYNRIISAFVRGKLKYDIPDGCDKGLFERSLDELQESEIDEIIKIGVNSGFKLHKFKRIMELPRVRKAVGIIRGLQPATLLDIGSGRGNFLWPLLDAFPYLNVTSVDIDLRRVNDINAVHEGGFDNLTIRVMDSVNLGFGNDSFEVVTALEVLEHIEDWKKALSEIVRVSSGFIIISVPSKEDDNPEHIHLLSGDTLKEELERKGVKKVSIEYILNHIIVIARK